MHTPSAPDLLQPSLSARAVRLAPYSHQAGFLVAFFGGPAAVLGITALNAHRVGRLPRDLAWLLPALLAWLLFEAWWAGTPSGRQFNGSLQALLGPSGPRYAERALGLLGFALSCVLHRREQRAADMLGLTRPNGWIAGLAFVVAGYVFGQVLAQVLTLMARQA